MQQIIALHGVVGHSYADDTQAYDHCKPEDLPVSIAKLQRCFTGLSSWMASNRLKLNPDKTEFIIFGPRFKLEQVRIDSLVLGGVSVQVSHVARKPRGLNGFSTQF